MKRKLIASLLALSMVAMSIVGCGNNDSSSGSSAQSNPGTESQDGGGRIRALPKIRMMEQM